MLGGLVRRGVGALGRSVSSSTTQGVLSGGFPVREMAGGVKSVTDAELGAARADLARGMGAMGSAGRGTRAEWEEELTDWQLVGPGQILPWVFGVLAAGAGSMYLVRQAKIFGGTESVVDEQWMDEMLNNKFWNFKQEGNPDGPGVAINPISHPERINAAARKARGFGAVGGRPLSPDTE